MDTDLKELTIDIREFGHLSDKLNDTQQLPKDTLEMSHEVVADKYKNYQC